jgi:arylsulfatase A-like enzyme
MADDLGYADLSCYGRREYRTSAIDHLAATGVRLTNAYANSPVCSATRIALITGRYQYRLRAGLEEPLGPGSVYGLPPEQPTLPSMLRDAGYSTSLVGKWHMGALPQFGPRQSGYDEFWGIRGGGVDYFSHTALGRADLWDNDQPIEKTGYLTDLLGQRTIDIIERQRRDRDPFFLSLHFTAPHWPWEGPDDIEVSQRLSADTRPLALAQFDGGDMATYAAMVTRMDHQIGRILGALERNGLTDDTIVVFTSDNGGERFSDVWPFTGRKGELLEGGIRIPALFRWPGYCAAGTISDQTCMSMDWLPTLLSAAGVPMPGSAQPDGIDILPSLQTPGRTVDRDLFWRYLNLDQQACRSGRLKYLKILDNSFLFDVVSDPLERANLKDRKPEEFARLVALYESWDRGMLPLDPAAFTHGFSGRDMADHFGVIDPAPVQPDAH